MSRFLDGFSADVLGPSPVVDSSQSARCSIESMLERITDGFFALDRQWHFTYVNQNGAAIFRRSHTELIGRDIWAIFPEAVDTRFKKECDEAMATGKARSFEEYYAPYGGWYEVSVYPSETGLSVFVRDATEHHQAAEALRVSEARAKRQLAEIEAIYRSAPIGLCIFDQQLRWVRLNDRIAEINGVPAGDHIGRTPREIVPDVGEQAEEALRKILQTGELLEFEMTGTTTAQPGVLRCWNERWGPIKDSEGQVVGISVAAEEITERKRAELALSESEERFRLAADHFPGVFNIYDDQMRLQFVNQQFVRLTGMPADELVGKRPDEVFPDTATRLYVPTLRKAYETKNIQSAEITVARPDGTDFTYEITYVPLLNERGEVRQVLGIGRDLSVQKEAEAVLRRSRDELEALVQERTAELTRRTNLLQVLTLALTRTEDRERRRLATLLHDHLQQLLVAAKISVGTLTFGQPDTRELQTRVDAVRHLLDQSIAASRSLTAELAPPVLYESGLCDGLEWLQTWMAEKHGLAIRLSCDGQADSMSEDMRVLAFQAVRELLFNVVKHAGVQQAIVTMRSDSDGPVRVTVSDQGAGFDVTEVRGRTVGGFGLFSIRERLAAAGGAVEVDSAPGCGTRIALILPGKTAANAPVSAGS